MIAEEPPRLRLVTGCSWPSTAVSKSPTTTAIVLFGHKTSDGHVVHFFENYVQTVVERRFGDGKVIGQQEYFVSDFDIFYLY